MGQSTSPWIGCDNVDDTATMAIQALRGFALEVESLAETACNDAGVVEALLPRLEARMDATIRFLEEKAKTAVAAE